MGFDLPKDTDDALRLARLSLDALSVISSLVGGATSQSAASVITIIKVIIAALEDGFEGKVTVEEVERHLQQLKANLMTNDQAADAALKKKFDTSDTED